MANTKTPLRNLPSAGDTIVVRDKGKMFCESVGEGSVLLLQRNGDRINVYNIASTELVPFVDSGGFRNPGNYQFIDRMIRPSPVVSGSPNYIQYDGKLRRAKQ